MKNKKDNYRIIFSFGLMLMYFAMMSISAYGQNKWVFEDDGCGATRWSNKNIGDGTISNNGAFALRIKENTISAPPKKLDIDTGVNGGIRIKAWERKEVFIKACVQASGSDEAEANLRAENVRIETADGVIRAVSSLATEGDRSFGVSYDIRVPVNTDLKLKTNNGGINLKGIRGAIEFDLNNGGAILENLAGSIHGRNVNGGITINLSGDKWDGEGIQTQTVNGSIVLNIPEEYSAKLEVGTLRGRLYGNLPIESNPGNSSQLNLNLGTGGALIKSSTGNGRVTVTKFTPKKD